MGLNFKLKLFKRKLNLNKISKKKNRNTTFLLGSVKKTLTNFYNDNIKREMN